MVYSTFDWGIRDKDGYYFILGRTDDVINVAGHRLGTREIEEAVNMHPNIAECAVVGVADPIKGQMPLAFAVLKDSTKKTTAEEVLQTVDKQLGAIARPKAVHFVSLLPKTRSGKTLRRSIQALAEGRDPGDLTTIEDPNALEQIRQALQMKNRPMLTLDDCRKITAAAEAEAKKNNWNVCIAILDDGGHLLHLVRMDGATPANARIAVEKGRTAAESRRSSGAWQERIKARPEMLRMPGITPIQGGLPIVVEGTCVGGIGISGVQSHEDEQIAVAGIKALTT